MAAHDREVNPTGSIALTFDDGPDPVWTPRVLDALAASDARATFFVVAPLAVRHPEILCRVSDEGHEVALHCNRHVRHDHTNAEEILSDASDGLRSLGRLGHETRTWRVPWGVVTPDTEAVAGELGLRLVGWTADSEDWRGGDARAMLARLRPGIGPGAIVLMHDAVGPGATRGGCGQTVALVAPLVEAARARGLGTVTVGALAGDLPSGNPRNVAGV